MRLGDIKLMALNYSMGDALTEITPITEIKGRGIKTLEGAGRVQGAGTEMYEEIRWSGIPALLIPGMHRSSPFLDKRLRRLYSHHGAGDKISAAYCAYKAFGYENFILSDVSANTVTIVVKEGKLIGGVDAALGAPGLLQGPIDVDAIRKIDAGQISANEAFSTGGLLKGRKSVQEFLAALRDGEADAVEVMDSLVLAVCMEISSLTILVENCSAVILTGEIGSMEDPFNFADAVGNCIDYPVYTPVSYTHLTLPTKRIV